MRTLPYTLCERNADETSVLGACVLLLFYEYHAYIACSHSLDLNRPYRLFSFTQWPSLRSSRFILL
jgi:hypothetical protein